MTAKKKASKGKPPWMDKDKDDAKKDDKKPKKKGGRK
jgi:hypothetical protein